MIRAGEDVCYNARRGTRIGYFVQVDKALALEASSRMDTPTTSDPILADLNLPQRQAVEHGSGPLLIVAGAGTGKTKTLVHRVARLIASGVDPSRILLMTFTRRAAGEMLRRVEHLLRRVATEAEGSDDDARRASTAADPRFRSLTQKIWGGTFHAVATRLLRAYGQLIGLDPTFTIHDRGDSEDFLDVIRAELNLGASDKRFPRKGTCLAIYSHVVNSQLPLAEVLKRHFPWCLDHEDALKRLFQTYVERKDRSSVLDYDDLLAFFQGLVSDPESGEKIRSKFECVLVDEYQDTNPVQAEILKGLRPDGSGLTVVGDDAQSIYSFRAATVRNILDFPAEFPGTTVIKLEQNYRSTQPILTATNHVIAESSERFQKNLWSEREQGAPPDLVQCLDEDEQTEFVVERILEHREAGVDLRRQAVLFRAAHHSIMLEAELTRRQIPFVKYGGLKFVETAHVKDLLSILRFAENPRDMMAGQRSLTLMPGIGAKTAQRLMADWAEAQWNSEVLRKAKVPAECSQRWQQFVSLLVQLRLDDALDVPAQVHAARVFYEPLLAERYDNSDARMRDLEQVELASSRFVDRAELLAQITLDPPSSTQDLAADPSLDDDYLILSTIHSAKGLEWDSVYVLHAADGNIPSDLATRAPEEVEEERRLFYVALTRAKNRLYVCHPLKYFQVQRGPRADRHGLAQLTRFLPKRVQQYFHRRTAAAPVDAALAAAKRESVRRSSQSLWG